MKDILQQVASANGVSKKEVEREIEFAISCVMESENAVAREKFKQIPSKKDVPSPEELIVYLVNRVLLKLENAG